MNPFKNDAEELTDDNQDAANADPRIDYEPPETESQSGSGDGSEQGG